MIQLCIIAVYLALTVLVGVLSRKNKTSGAFHGEGLGLLLCVAVGAGEWLGGTSTTGVSEYGYSYGLSGAWYTIANGVGICVLAVFFTRLFRRIGRNTVPGIIESYIGGRTRVVSAVMQIFILVVVGTSQLIAIGTIGEALLHLSAPLSIIILGSAVLLYTVLGGMRAVGKTNIMHMLVMYGGVLAAVLICLIDIGGIGTLTRELPESYFSMSTIGYGKVSSWIVASVLGGCVAQAGLQPILSAKDDRTAVRSSYLVALIVAPFGLVTALLGMIARYRFPNLQDAKMALPTLLMSLHPMVGGVLIAAVVAAILSTASPIFLSCGTLFTTDVYCAGRRGTAELSDRKKLRISKLSTLVTGLACIALAVLLYHQQKVLDIVYFAYSLRGSMFVVLLLGIYWKRVSPLWANIAMISTMLVGLFWVVFRQIYGTYPIHRNFSDTYAAILVALTVTLIGSILTNYKKRKYNEKNSD